MGPKGIRGLSMYEEQFKQWLIERGSASAGAGNTRSFAVRTIERNLAGLGSPHADLDAAWADDRFAALRQKLKDLRSEARAGETGYRLLMPASENPDNRLSSWRSWLGQYGQFLDTRANLPTTPDNAAQAAMLEHLAVEDIEAAMEECDELGLKAFLGRGGFVSPQRWILRDTGTLYPAKAVIAAAIRFLPDGAALTAKTYFNSFGESQALARLKALGYLLLSAPEFDRIRETFCINLAPFEGFDRTWGPYWEIERKGKAKAIAFVAERAAGDDDDATLGRAVLKRLSTGQGSPIGWQAPQQLGKADPAISEPIYAALGALVRSEETAAEAMARAAAVLHAARDRGLDKLTIGAVTSIIISIRGTARPTEAAWFKVEFMRDAARRLFDIALFDKSVANVADFAEYLRLMHVMFGLLREQSGWNPADMFDVQGFCYVGMIPPEKWTREWADQAGDSDDLVLAHFDRSWPEFKALRALWSAEQIAAFCNMARVVNEAGLDQYESTSYRPAGRSFQVGTKDRTNQRAGVYLGNFTLRSGETYLWLQPEDATYRLDETGVERCRADLARLIVERKIVPPADRQAHWPDDYGAKDAATIVDGYPDAGAPAPPMRNHWFVGSSFGRTDDQTERFLSEGVWEINNPGDSERRQVMAMQAGDPIAIKATFVQRRGFDFDTGGRIVSVMRIKARGIIAEPSVDGERIKVDWEAGFVPRLWCFYTYQRTIWQVVPNKETARRLIAFAFNDVPQDYAWFIKKWNWDVVLPAPDAEHEAPPAIIWTPPVNRILYGPPGTGKTYTSMAEAVALADGLGTDDPLLKPEARRKLIARYEELGELGRIGFVTFHQSYGYEDFVEGLRPASGRADGLALEVVPGVLRRMAAAAERSDDPHVLVIDEINRGNISKIFGELITLIEPDKRIGGENPVRVLLPYSGADGSGFCLPPNLHILGTMNTADRSIALLDTALRRRFTFREMAPDPTVLSKVVNIDLPAVLTAINDRIEFLIDREHRIGHAFFMGCASKPDVDAVMRDKVIPLLQEYFFEDWSRLAAVLGDAGNKTGNGEGGFLAWHRLVCPLGSGEERWSWSVRAAFADDCYARLLGKAAPPPAEDRSDGLGE